ncbi:unnamed protein product [Absidia cylindrospora]
MFGWNPPWHRKNPNKDQLSSGGEQHRRQERTSCRQTQPKKSAVEDDSLYYNSSISYNDNESILSPPLNQTMDIGYTSPISSSSSSFTSSFRRNTKASVLEFFHRRKSNTPSVMSSQTSSQQSFPAGPLSSLPVGRKSTIPTTSPPLTSAATTTGSIQSHSTNNNAMHTTSPPSALSPTSPCSGSSSHQITTTNTGTTSSSASSNQHHRFPFIHHHHHHHHHHQNEVTNTAAPIIEEQHPPLYQHRHSSLSPHNALTSYPSSTATPRSSSVSASLRPYDSLIKNSESFYEHTMDMEDSAPPTFDDTNRITLRHDLIKLVLDGLFKSPLDPQQEGERQVLQIGCGNGSWSLDCAKEFPHWFILGLDDRNGGPLISAASGKKILLSGTSSSSSSSSAAPLPNKTPLISSTSPSATATTVAHASASLPSSATPGGHGNNFRFIRSATSLVESLKLIPDNQFDLVYGRFLALSLPPSEYEDLVSECWRVCKSGGFVEFTELDMRIYGSSGSGILVKRLNQQVVSAMKKRKLDPRLPRHLQDLFFKLLVEDQPASSRRRQTSYQVKYNSLPLGVWGGRMGVMFRDDIHDVLDALDVTTTSPVDDDPSDKDDEQRLPEHDWKATTDVLDDELDSHMAFMNLYQIFAQKHKV